MSFKNLKIFHLVNNISFGSIGVIKSIFEKQYFSSKKTFPSLIE